MNAKKNPFDKSFRPVLGTIDAATVGTRLLQSVMKLFGLTQSEAEVLITVASYRKPALFEDVCNDNTHLTKDAVKRALILLTNNGHVSSQSVIDHEDFVYIATEEAKSKLASFHREDIETMSAASYQEAIVNPALQTVNQEEAEVVPIANNTEPVEEHEAATNEPALEPAPTPTDHTDPVPIGLPNADSNSFPLITPELEEALAFCYTLVMPGADANAILKQYPETAKESAKSIYYRHPQIIPYEDALTLTYGTNIPEPGPVSEPVQTPVKGPKLGLVATVIKAIQDWFADKR